MSSDPITDDALLKIAWAIVQCLPDSGQYKLRPYGWQTYADAADFGLTFSARDGKITIDSYFPKFRAFTVNGPSAINVSDKKTWVQIARDIERRLLPEILTTVERLTARKNAADADQAVVDYNVQAVLAAAPFLNPTTETSVYGVRHLHISGSAFYGKVYVSQDVDLDISNIPVKVAVEIFKLLETASPTTARTYGRG
jgi:hypothetical protein